MNTCVAKIQIHKYLGNVAKISGCKSTMPNFVSSTDDNVSNQACFGWLLVPIWGKCLEETKGRLCDVISDISEAMFAKSCSPNITRIKDDFHYRLRRMTKQCTHSSNTITRITPNILKNANWLLDWGCSQARQHRNVNFCQMWGGNQLRQLTTTTTTSTKSNSEQGLSPLLNLIKKLKSL